MTPEQQRIFESIPPDVPRSRLEPHRDLILRWRRQGRTYHRIRELLAEQFNVKVAYAVLYRFVQRRSKPRKPDLESDTASASPSTAPSTQPPAPGIPRLWAPGTRLCPEERAAQAEYIRSLNRQEVVEEPPKRQRSWIFDPNKPRSNRKH